MPSFKEFDFEVLQLRYLKAGMDQLPTFQPDGKTAVQVQALRDEAEAIKVAFQTADTTLALARGELNEIAAAAHLLCVQVHPILKSRYRKDPGNLEAIMRLPTDDKTVRATRERMKAISLLWADLPHPPGTNQPFKAWDTMDKAAFDAVLANLVAQDEAFPGIVQAYEKAQMNLHEKMDAVEDFVTAALIQGRAQFPEGSPEREIIDAIPMEQAQQPPAKANITLATSPGPGQVSLEFSAAHATMFDIFQKGPGDEDFTEIATDTIQRSFVVEGLADGEYQFRVAGQNSLGNGPISEIVGVTVGSGGGTIPATPGAPTLTALMNGQVLVEWGPVARATFFIVERMVLGQEMEYMNAGNVGASNPSTTLTSLPPGETVRVRLIAANASGQSQPGPHAEIELPAPPPG